MESCCFPCDQVPESDCRDLFYSQARQCDESGLPPREALAWIVFTFLFELWRKWCINMNHPCHRRWCVTRARYKGSEEFLFKSICEKCAFEGKTFAQTWTNLSMQMAMNHRQTYQPQMDDIPFERYDVDTSRWPFPQETIVPCKTMWCICQAARYWLRSPQPSITPPPAKQSFLLLASQEGDRKCQRCFLGCFSYRPPPPPPPVPPMPCGGNPDWLSWSDRNMLHISRCKSLESFARSHVDIAVPSWGNRKPT